MTDPLDVQIIQAVPWLPIAMLGGQLLGGLFGRAQHGRQLSSEDARHAASLRDRAEARKMTSADYRWMVQQELDRRKAMRDAARPGVQALLGKLGGAAGINADQFMACWQGGGAPMPQPAPVGGGQQPMPVVSQGPPPAGAGGGMGSNPLLQYLLYSELGRGGDTPPPAGPTVTNQNMPVPAHAPPGVTW